MWVPGVNNLGAFGRWAFLEIDASNLHKTKQELRRLISESNSYKSSSLAKSAI
jgi:type III restriction enzyme